MFDAAETSESSASLIAPYPNNVSVSVGQKATFRCTISVSSSGSSSSSSRLPRVQVNSVQCAPVGRNQKFAGRGLLFSHLFRHFPSFLFPSLPFIFVSLSRCEVALQIRLMNLGLRGREKRHIAATRHVPWALSTPKMRSRPGKFRLISVKRNLTSSSAVAERPQGVSVFA